MFIPDVQLHSPKISFGEGPDLWVGPWPPAPPSLYNRHWT